mmetsp:Transcript_35057/g.39772  ORF Transcript_35057/g.39772 Transcript_35057/m.39772 type:complete len:255 (+) Transcript_35057:171-935(+)
MGLSSSTKCERYQYCERNSDEPYTQMFKPIPKFNQRGGTHLVDQSSTSQQRPGRVECRRRVEATLDVQERISSEFTSHIGAEYTPNGIRELAAMLAINTTLRVLDCGFAKFPSTNYEPLSKALQVNTSLKELHLYDCSLQFHAIQTLMQGFTKNRSLEKINLSYNFCEDRGASVIAKALKYHASVREVFLHDIKATDKGFFALAEAVSINKRISRLGFTENRLSHSLVCNFRKYDARGVFFLFAVRMGKMEHGF